MTKNIIIIILILGFIASVVLLDVPKAQSVLNLRQQIKTQEGKLAEKRDLMNIVEKLTASYKEKQDVLGKLDYIMPSNQDVPNLIVQLEAIANQGGVILQDVNITVGESQKGESKATEVRTGETQTGTSTSAYRFLVVDLKLLGDYPAFKNFLQALEENIRLMDIESITFMSKTESATPLFEFEVVLKTYYQ